MCVYTYVYTYSSQYGDAGKTKEIKSGATVNAACHGILSACHVGLAFRRFGIPGIGGERVKNSNTGVL